MGLTISQQNAVDVRDRTLLVSAAAGSGKTYTLTQRIIKAIIEDGQDLSRLLIVTFTRAAAGELKAKISKALGEAIAAHPENLHLQKQLIKLGSAHISTIDSFFSEPVRANFDRLALPASMRLSDDAELSPIREKILGEVLDSFFEKCEPYSKAELSPVGYKNRYTELMGIISGARDFSNILPTFFDIYKKLITSPIGLEQLNNHSNRLKGNASRDFFDTLEGKALKEELYSTVQYAWKTFIKCSDDMQSDEVVASKYTNDFLQNAELCHSLLIAIEDGDYDGVKCAFELYKPGRITPIPKDMKSELSEYYKDLRTELNNKVKNLAKSYLYLSQDRIHELFSVYSDMCALLYDILVCFDEKYSEEKRRRGVCEFADMPKFMLKLLVGDDGKPTEYAKSLSEKFDEVYIDEYQDVNEIQDTIFALIGGSHRFMVGDIKQSIYGFREAEPSIFADYRRKFKLYDKENDSLPEESDGGNTIFMSENFRCDENVIKFTNSVCSDIFSAFSESIGYTPEDDLKFGKGRPYEDYQSPQVSINIVQTPEDCEDDREDGFEEEKPYEQDSSEEYSGENAGNLADEAIVAANEIALLLKNGKNADGTPITAGNIAVLVRSNIYIKPLIRTLGALNIKYTLSNKGELFETEDMRLLVNLLSVIDNPREDMPLCHILTSKSEVYKPDFTLEEIIKIRKAADNSRSLYDAMVLCSESKEMTELSEKCAFFISTVEKMRLASGRMSADKLIKSLISSEKYSALTKTDAFTYLYDSACRYVKTTWSSLYSFINYFKDIMEKGEAGAEPDAKVTDAIRIMSIHQSKGLEFNVCLLFGFGKQFNMQNRYPLIFNKEFGPSMKLPPEYSDNVIDNISMRYEDNPIFKTVDKFNKLRQLEEEARIFYVALTRARERLVITATISKPYTEYLKRLRNTADSIYEIRKSRTYINWILLSIAKSDDAEKICDIKVFDKKKVCLTVPFLHVSANIQSSASAGEDKDLAVLMNLKENTSPESALLANIPSKIAASKISSHMLDDTVFVPIPTGKLFSEDDGYNSEGDTETARQIKARIELMRSSKHDFESLLEENKKPTAAEIGTACHAFLQFCDYDNVEKNGLEEEILRLTDSRFISERTAKIINRSRIKGFFESELYKYVRQAKNIRREFHFGMFRPASDLTKSEDLKKIVNNKKIFVQGSVDLLLEMPDGSIILCDYKSDRIFPEERIDTSLFIHRMRETHAEQLAQYEYAISKIFSQKPDKIFIYSLALGDSIEL